MCSEHCRDTLKCYARMEFRFCASSERFAFFSSLEEQSASQITFVVFFLLHSVDKWHASAAERKSICFVGQCNFGQTTVLANQVDGATTDMSTNAHERGPVALVFPIQTCSGKRQ